MPDQLAERPSDGSPARSVRAGGSTPLPGFRWAGGTAITWLPSSICSAWCCGAGLVSAGTSTTPTTPRPAKPASWACSPQRQSLLLR